MSREIGPKEKAMRELRAARKAGTPVTVPPSALRAMATPVPERKARPVKKKPAGKR